MQEPEDIVTSGKHAQAQTILRREEEREEAEGLGRTTTRTDGQNSSAPSSEPDGLRTFYRERARVGRKGLGSERWSQAKTTTGPRVVGGI